MAMDFPVDFRCPISMELMQDPVTISTGVTYERKNIEKWLFSYNKKTCPTTMQRINSFDITPNHTLKRLILAWQNEEAARSCESRPVRSLKHDELVSLLATMESTPFKVNSLKKLRAIVGLGHEVKDDFMRCACEEALGVLHQYLSLSEEDEKTIQLLSKPESIKSLAIMLQRGSGEARFYAVTIFQKLAQVDYNWKKFVIQDQGFEFFRSLLELVSDDQICTKASASALELLIEILDHPRQVEGRLALVEHGLGIAAISKKLLHVSSAATKITVKILWLICSYHPSERVLEELLIFGSVKKLLALLHIDNRSSTKEKVVKIFKLHGNSWRQNPCSLVS
ncbi:E3 ubiquitin-protein ligase PUB23 [Vitis vinifera]|uniref:U-box domain-containing protein n=1 Tax=Vitis vinifera TaxID=29760 RepID=A0A438HT42_VITVI|nr:E3 ubiquitin-protein ligase PUB23 [Vitis vinifera]